MSEKSLPFSIQEFAGRDELISYNQLVRRPVYQAKVPLQWRRIDPPLQESNLDFTKPIVSFIIGNQITLNVHNFPSNSLEERVSIATQIEKWCTQLKNEACQIKKVEQGGFSGLYFEGKKSQQSLLAWALQLDCEHYQKLHFFSGTLEEEEHYRQMAADITIKINGPSDLIEKYRQEIFLFASSFGLLEEVPMRT